MTMAINASDPNAGDWWGAVIQDSLYGPQAFHSAKISVQQRVHCRSCPTVWRESVIVFVGWLHVFQSKDFRKLLRIFRACAEFQPPAKPPSRAGSLGSRRLDRSAKRGGGRARARPAAEREDGGPAARAPRGPPRRCRAGTRRA